jgi:hypothetical protein
MSDTTLVSLIDCYLRALDVWMRMRKDLKGMEEPQREKMEEEMLWARTLLIHRADALAGALTANLTCGSTCGNEGSGGEENDASDAMRWRAFRECRGWPDTEMAAMSKPPEWFDALADEMVAQAQEPSE